MRKHSLVVMLTAAFCVSAFAAGPPGTNRKLENKALDTPLTGPMAAPQAAQPCGQLCTYFEDFDDTLDFVAGTWIGNGLNGAAGGIFETWSATCSSNPNRWPGGVVVGPVEGHVETASPFSGTQHVRLSKDFNMLTDPFGCQMDARVPASAVAGPNPTVVGPQTVSAYLAQPGGAFGQDFKMQPQAPAQGFLTTILLFHYYGVRYTVDRLDLGGGPGNFYVFVGNWDTTGGYEKYTMHTDPCAKYTCNGGANDALPCTGGLDCPGGTCNGLIEYSDGTGLFYTGQLWAGTTIDQILFFGDNTGGGVPQGLDIDDVAIDRDPNPCPQVCGDFDVTGTEECEAGIDSLCPGLCVAPGGTGANGEAECTCGIGPCTTSQDLPNGGPQTFSNHFGWWTFTADAPAYAVDTCGTIRVPPPGYDSALSVWTGTCDSLSLIVQNDDCSNYPGYGDNSDPLASCYDPINFAGPDYNSCLCVSTTIGQQYWVWDSRVSFGLDTVITLTKRLACDNGDQEFGACCDPFVGCVDVASAAACDPRGSFIATKTCAGVGDECPAPTLGACCDRVSGGCTETTAAACTGNSTYSAGSRCSETTCVLANGACCDATAFAVECTDGATFDQCQGANDTWTKDTLCADVTCTAAPIPTVSEWGLVIMALLLLVGAKVYFGRREALA